MGEVSAPFTGFGQAVGVGFKDAYIVIFDLRLLITALSIPIDSQLVQLLDQN